MLLVAATDTLRQLIASYGLAQHVILPGFQANPYSWIKYARALVLSSDFEALPGVLIEALICGTPVVSTDCPSGPNEILTGPLAHWLTPVNDPQALAEKIQEVLDHPYQPDLNALQRFEIHTILQQYQALLPAAQQGNCPNSP